MVRKVSGYLTSTGAYFNRIQDAKAYEAVQRFNAAVEQFLDDSNVVGLTREFFIDKFREFVLSEKGVIKDYIALVHSIPIPEAHDIRNPEPGPTTGPVTYEMQEHSLTESVSYEQLWADIDDELAAIETIEQDDGGGLESPPGTGEESTLDGVV